MVRVSKQPFPEHECGIFHLLSFPLKRAGDKLLPHRRLRLDRVFIILQYYNFSLRYDQTI